MNYDINTSLFIQTVTWLHTGHLYGALTSFTKLLRFILPSWKGPTSIVFRISSFGFHIRNIVVQYNMKVSRWCLNVHFGVNSPFKLLKLTQTLIKERLYPLSESDFLAVCPTGADVREDLKGALHGADISAEAWGSSLLWVFQSQLDNQTTCRVTSSPLPSLPLRTSQAWGSTSQTLGSPLARAGRQI